jgi:peptidoglycan/xylan/chitin deacetylase (PgdA/CDA1 family)
MKKTIKQTAKKLFHILVPNKVLLTSGKSLSSDNNSIYLTYDDGPDPDATPDLLDLLDKNSAKATFFVIGNLAEKHPDIVKDIFDRGHTVANHSYNHSKFSKLSLDEQLKEIEQTNEALFNITGEHCKIFRPPQGFISISLLFALYKKGICTINWSRDSDDCRYSSEEVIKNIENKPLCKDDIVLMHDDSRDAILITQNIFSNDGTRFSFKGL